jgi:putative membrane protein
MVRLLVHWAVVAASLWVTTRIVPGVHIGSVGALVVAAAVLGLVNALVRPVLVVLSLPITILTLGLFYIAVNALCFGLAASLVQGFSVGGVLPALLGALVTSVVSSVLGLFVDD